MGRYSTSVWKVCKRGGKKSTILKNIGVKILQLLGVLKERGKNLWFWNKIGVKILQVWKWGQNFTWLKNRDQNSTMLEKGRSIFYIWPLKVWVKFLHRLKKWGQKGRAYPLPQTYWVPPPPPPPPPTPNPQPPTPNPQPTPPHTPNPTPPHPPPLNVSKTYLGPGLPALSKTKKFNVNPMLESCASDWLTTNSARGNHVPWHSEWKTDDGIFLQLWRYSESIALPKPRSFNTSLITQAKCQFSFNSHLVPT